MITRRNFLETCGATAAAFAVPTIVRGRSVNEKLQVAAIGCDGKGWSDISEMAGHGQVQTVAFCDVDLDRTQKVRKLNPEAPVFQDYREMFARLGDKIDAVTVSTPDHMHAYIALDAMRQGKHVYCQKPLTHTVWEARQMRLQTKKSGVITRMGNQIHSHTYYRTAVNVIQSGAIGKIKQVHSWCGATGHGKSFHIDRPKKSAEVPKSVDWDLWIGVAPMRPFGGNRVYHPWGWRDWQDFGNGALGDFGCHILDPVFTALKINGAPFDLKADHTGMNDEVWPAQNTVEYTFPGNEFTTDKTLKITWNDGGRLPSVNGSHVPPTTALPGSGSLFIGEEGSLVLPHVGALRLYPQEKFADYKVEPAEDLNHYHGWVDGCLTGKQPSDGFEYGGALTEAVLLGNIAVRFREQLLKWDAEALKFTNLDEANRWITRDYRDGWEIKPVV
jgi:predicted dehydrogenase